MRGRGGGEGGLGTISSELVLCVSTAAGTARGTQGTETPAAGHGDTPTPPPLTPPPGPMPRCCGPAGSPPCAAQPKPSARPHGAGRGRTGAGKMQVDISRPRSRRRIQRDKKKTQQEKSKGKRQDPRSPPGRRRLRGRCGAGTEWGERKGAGGGMCCRTHVRAQLCAQLGGLRTEGRGDRNGSTQPAPHGTLVGDAPRGTPGLIPAAGSPLAPGTATDTGQGIPCSPNTSWDLPAPLLHPKIP